MKRALIVAAFVFFPFIMLLFAVECTNNVKTNQIPNLQSIEVTKTNAPTMIKPPTFEEGVAWGALAARRNPDVQDVQLLTRIAYGLWQQQQVSHGQGKP